MKNFKDWAVKQFGVKELESDDESKVPVDMLKAMDIGFKQNRSGKIILPPIYEYKTVRQKQRVIRGYIGAQYSQLLQSILFPPFFLLK